MKNERADPNRRLEEIKFKQVSRRELLKLTPLLALGAFAIPSLQEGLLKKGLGFQRLGFGASFSLRASGDDLR